MLSYELVVSVSLTYIALLFLIGYYAYRQKERGQSIISNSYVYSLSIAVYATSWTFYGSVGKAATSGLDYLLIYLGPSLTAFSWWFLLRKIVRITKENNITSIADFISSRYGKSQWLGALVTVIAMLGIMPYIALQLKAVSTTFDIICGASPLSYAASQTSVSPQYHSGFYTALILSLFAVVFGARKLVSSERHEGLVAAIAVESLVKLITFLTVGVFVTYFLFDGFIDIFTRIKAYDPLVTHLTTFGETSSDSYTSLFSMLFLSMGAIMLLPRQFHIMVIENSSEEHIKQAMWRFPTYLFLINLFVMPIALGGIIFTGSNAAADYFVLTLPLKSGHYWLALLAFLGGFSAAAGMVMVESVAISTMILNHIVMPLVVTLKPRSWFPMMLINIKRFGIFLVVFLGYFYHLIVGESYMLANMGLISFAAAAQFGPSLIGGLYWRRGNKAGAIVGISLGFTLWFYTLLLPSLLKSGWWQSDILERGLFGSALLKPTELFGLTGFDVWTHSLFWSMFMNIAGYLVCSIVLSQTEKEKEQVLKFVDVFHPQQHDIHWETKRLSKPITILQFVNLMAKFVGEAPAYAAISEYLGDREIDEKGGVSEFELPSLKRFIEKTLAGSVGAAAAGAIVESYLSDIGSKMESVYDIFSNVRTSLDQSRESLYVRLRASEIMNRSLDLRFILEDLLELLRTEFKFDLAVIRLRNEEGLLVVKCFKGLNIRSITENNLYPEIDTYVGEAYLSGKPQFVNDSRNITKLRSREIMEREDIRSFAHIPIASEGEQVMGILSVFSRTIVGLFTEPFLRLLLSLAGQLAQAVKIVEEREAKERERMQKEKALLDNAKVLRELEIAKQIQLSLLPDIAPQIAGMRLAGHCLPATHVGGDYFDFFSREENIVDMVIADVSGHSVGAALIMVETRTFLRAQSNAVNILPILNHLLYDDLTRAELFITMFYARYNTSTRLLDYCNAGHNLPLVFREGAYSCIELDAEGLILGVKLDVEFEEKSIQLLSGDVVLFYTDGISEAQNSAGDLFGTGRLCSLLARLHGDEPGVIISSIIAEVTQFCHPLPLNDDVSMIVLKVD